MEPKFIHLRAHSSYSLLEGAMTTERLVEEAISGNMPALGLADSDNMFGALEFSEAMAQNGIQPIIGITLCLLAANPDAKGGKLALYAKNDEGYRNLLALVSHAHLNASDYGGHIGVSHAMLAKHSEGIICLTGGGEGALDVLLAAGQNPAANDIFALLNNIFKDNLYVELQRYSNYSDPQIEAALIDLAYAHDVPLVATNQALFAAADDYESHDALICIAEGRYVDEQDRRHYSPDHRLKSPEEMRALFADLPEALENTVEIAQRCAFRPLTCAPMLPAFGVEDETAELRAQAEAGLRHRLATTPLSAAESDYHARLDYELKVIADMGFAGYFLIVADFIKWAKDKQIAVGPGRGSGAGSVVAWSLTITDLDPLRFNLLFERFLNPERVSMPDFDIDFCQTRRDEVIHYVQQRYGDERVAQIITFGKLQARAVLRDVGRVLQVPYMQVDRLCKMIPNNPAAPVGLQGAIDTEPRMQKEIDDDPHVQKMLEISLKLEGLYRHASTHAAGVVIADRPLRELVPLYCDPKSSIAVTQFNMKWVEKAGLVKFDFLGLKTLTMIEQTLKLLPADNRPDIERIPLDDPKTFELLQRGDTVGVFQLEGSGMRDAMRRMQIDVFEEIIALVALYRPGPMENIPRYIAVKSGKEKPNYLHPTLEPLLSETHGVIIYQEQVMQIAQVLSGYSLGEADLLRRAMGKKIKSEMTAQKQRFIDGAIEKGVSKQKAAEIFDLVAKFAGYGFNKSHAAAYALIAYQTAYLKANHPLAFYAASMTLDYERTEKLSAFRQDAAAHDILLAPPDINDSRPFFGVQENKITYALSAIRNVGRGAMEALVQERTTNGAFTSITDFAQRAGSVGLNKRFLENLIKAGALDGLESNRASLMAAVDMVLGEAGAAQHERETNQVNLFAGEGAAEDLRLPDVPNWTLTTRLAHEYDAIGFYLSGHPLDDYEKVFERNRVVSSERLAQHTAREALLAGVVTKVQRRTSKRGKPFAFLAMSDIGGQFEITIFSEVLEQSGDLLEEGNLLVAGVKIEHTDGDDMRLTASSLRSVDALAAQSDAGLRIFVNAADVAPDIYASLKQHLEKVRTERGKKGGIVSITIQSDSREVEIELADKYSLTPPVTASIKAMRGINVREV